MGESTRILPPLVTGKLSGIVEFIIDEIELTGKTISSHTDFNCVVQILWWGETKPLYLRPKKSPCNTKNKEVFKGEKEINCAKYEIRTKLALFKSYLSKCDTVELIVLNNVKNEVIGSAFLKDLIHLVFSAQFFKSSIVDYSGDRIGEVTCHFMFQEINSEQRIAKSNSEFCGVSDTWSKSCLKIDLNLTQLNSEREHDVNGCDLSLAGSKGKRQSQALMPDSEERNLQSPLGANSKRGSNVHYNSPTSENANSYVNHSAASMKSLKYEATPQSKNANNSQSSKRDMFISDSGQSKCSDKIGKCNSSLSCHFEETIPKLDIAPDSPETIKVAKKKSPQGSKKKNSHFPQSEPLRTGNKQMCRLVKCTDKNAKLTRPTVKGVNQRTFISGKGATDKRTANGKAFPVKRTVKATKKDESEIVSGAENGKGKANASDNILKSLIKNSKRLRTFVKVSDEISKVNKIVLKSPETPLDNDSDLEKVPVKETDTDKSRDVVINSENDEYISKVATPVVSGNLNAIEVNSNDSDGIDKRSEIVDKVNVKNKLFFDLSDPIERLYYETFFLNAGNMRSNEFVIAEMLNQPENKFILNVTREDNEKARREMPRPSDAQLKNVKNDLLSNEMKSVPIQKMDELTLEEYRNEADENTVGIGGHAEIESEPIRKDEILSCNDQIGSCMKNDDIRERANLKTNRQCMIDCHRCKYYKKLNELDKIIESLKRFEDKLREEAKGFHRSVDGEIHGPSSDELNGLLLNSDSDRLLEKENENLTANLTEDDLSRDDFNFGFENNDSDLSRDDSDFIEFTRYLSNR